jgi:protoporphyrinogen oxidase
VNAEQVVWQLVRLFAAHDDPTLKTKVTRLTRTLMDYQPDFHRMLSARKKALEHAIQGKSPGDCSDNTRDTFSPSIIPIKIH